MEISIRTLVKELLENEYLIVSYVELDNGGFDLSVRINEKKLAFCVPKDNEENIKDITR